MFVSHFQKELVLQDLQDGDKNKMKVTVGQLRKIISEEVSRLLVEYEQSIIRDGDSLYIVDDEGNREFYDKVAGSKYSYLEDGQGVPYETYSQSRGPRRTNYDRYYGREDSGNYYGGSRRRW